MEQFDYIIVGAGSAGCVLANRLSTNPKITVLLLEAGGKDTNPWIHIPGGYFKTMHNPNTDWCFKIEKDPGLNNREMNYPRGKTLGGSSSINGMLYIRGQSGDYDYWRQLGNVGWSWEDVLPYFKKSEDNKWLKHVNEVKDYWRANLKMHPGEMSAARILRKLREVLPKESIVTTEVGQHQMWASLFFDAIHPGTFFSSTGLGTMGWGFPAAIGAKVARPDVPVLDIAGDGSFNMTENSLATSVLEDIPVIVFLINNFSLGMVAQWQRTFYDRRMIGIDLKICPDYVKLAESYGAQGIRAQSLDELGKAIKVGLNSDVATVIDIPIDPEEDVLPFVAPGTSLKDMILPS